MNKRLLYRNKIVRLYEDDIWGIFFRKQKKRDLFFKKIGYQLFLEIFRKNTRAVKPTIFAWKKKIFNTAAKYTYQNLVHKKAILGFFKVSLKYYLLANICQQLPFFNTYVYNKNYFLYIKKTQAFSNNSIVTVLRWSSTPVLVSKIPQFTLKLKGITLFKCFIKNTAYLTLYLYYNKTKKKKAYTFII